MKLSINTPESTHEYKVSTFDDLEKYFEEIKEAEMAEVWLEKDNGPSLSLFSNRGKAFLMYIPAQEEAGYTSINTDTISGTKEEVEIFMLHGQGDTRIGENFIDLEKGLAALEYFLENEEKDPTIEWHNDSDK